LKLTYELGYSDGKSITTIRKLDEHEFLEYSKACKCLFDFSENQHLYSINSLNYEEFFSTIKMYEETYSANPQLCDISVMEQIVLNVNRRLLNYLSSVRTFLDHTETRLKEKYGKQSIRVKNFDNACHNECNNNFSYRFFYKLRNYSQHIGMPIGKIDLNLKKEPELSGRAVAKMNIQFDRDLLLKYKEWKEPLLQQIKNLPKLFDVSPHVNTMMQCLERINLTLINHDLPFIIPSAEYIDGLFASIKKNQVRPTVFRIINESNKKYINEMTIPLNIVKYAIQMKKEPRKGLIEG
jgi:hypothetical protein